MLNMKFLILIILTIFIIHLPKNVEKKTIKDYVEQKMLLCFLILFTKWAIQDEHR